MIKLIATDMDGTWLREDKTYDKELFEKEFQIITPKEHQMNYLKAKCDIAA